MTAKDQSLKYWLPLMLAMLSGSLFFAVYFPMVTDEAYYMDWARRSPFPSFGFFDHPPFVSWQAGLSRILHSILAARVGVLVAAGVTFYFNWLTAYKLWGDRRAAFAAAAVAQATFGGIANSFLLTPDSGLALWWSIAVHEALVALRGNDRRWLTAGLATGAGLLAKYTMLLIGPVFLFGLIFENRRQLRSHWPYLGGVCALLVFSLNLYWNAQNNWTTLKFQFGHGFSVSQDITTSSLLPDARGAETGLPSMILYQDLQKAMGAVPGFEEVKRKDRPQVSSMERAWQYTGDYLGGVAGLWGGFIVVILTFMVRSTRSRSKGVYPVGFRFIQAAALGPIGFFFLLSPFTRIEANWPAMHMGAAAILLAGYWRPSLVQISGVFGLHLALALGLVVTAMFPSMAPYARSNRIVTEAAGYDALVRLLKSQRSSPVLAVDSYQLKSALAARLPEVLTSQWPGITRPSEYTRGAPDDLLANQRLLLQSHFYLLTFEDIPPELPGYQAKAIEGIRSCPDGRIDFYGVSKPVLPCEKGLRDWWLVSYLKSEK